MELFQHCFRKTGTDVADRLVAVSIGVMTSKKESTIN
jgi:hypothetical protein